MYNVDMKTLLLAINSQYIHSSLAPWYLAAAVGDAMSTYPELRVPDVLEFNINQAVETVSAEIIAAEPDILSISCYIWNIDYVKQLLPVLRAALPDCVIILGGPEVSYDSADGQGLYPEADHIICGEGESAFVSLLGYHYGLSEPSVSSAIPPNPYTPSYFEQLDGRIAYIESSRGCPFRCTFCLSGRDEPVRYFDMAQVKANLVRLANSGTETVKFVDRTFNCHQGRCIEIIRFILDAREKGDIPPGVCIHFEVAADLFEAESIELLRGAPAGLFQLEIGLQSFNEVTLDMIGRKTDIPKAIATVKQLRERNNIHLHLDLICGLPGEDLQSFGASFDRAFALSPHMLQLGFLKLIHGSKLREQSESLGIAYDPQPPYQVLSTPWLKAGEIKAVLLCAASLDRFYNSGRFPATCAYFLSRSEKLSAFGLFCSLGSFMGNCSGMPLEGYISGIRNYGDSVAGVDPEELRDCLVVDWLSTNHVGVLPLCLQRPDHLNSKIKRMLERNYASAGKPEGLGTRRSHGFGLLYGGGRLRVAVADYRSPRPVLGAYPLSIYEIDPKGDMI